MSQQVELRPIESVIVKLRSEGQKTPEIAKRIGKRPGTVERILDMIDFKADLPEQREQDKPAGRAVERVIHRLRDDGESYGEIGNRLNISGHQVRRIEEMASLKG